VERGADRLALIAGRIQTLPPSHDENTANAASDPSSQPLLSNDQDLQPQVSNQTTGTPSLFLSIFICMFWMRIYWVQTSFRESRLVVFCKFSKRAVES
jgi:hypothetical protein